VLRDDQEHKQQHEAEHWERGGSGKVHENEGDERGHDSGKRPNKRDEHQDRGDDGDEDRVAQAEAHGDDVRQQAVAQRQDELAAEVAAELAVDDEVKLLHDLVDRGREIGQNLADEFVAVQHHVERQDQHDDDVQEQAIEGAQEAQERRGAGAQVARRQVAAQKLLQLRTGREGAVLEAHAVVLGKLLDCAGRHVQLLLHELLNILRRRRDHRVGVFVAQGACQVLRLAV
jgi:hypothetical protein